jgi:hypothetical protein
MLLLVAFAVRTNGFTDSLWIPHEGAHAGGDCRYHCLCHLYKGLALLSLLQLHPLEVDVLVVPLNAHDTLRLRQLSSPNGLHVQLVLSGDSSTAIAMVQLFGPVRKPPYVAQRGARGTGRTSYRFSSCILASVALFMPSIRFIAASRRCSSVRASFMRSSLHRAHQRPSDLCQATLPCDGLGGIGNFASHRCSSALALASLSS